MEAKIVDGVLHIEAPLTKGHISSTGKSTVLFTTSGFVKVDGTDNVQVSINVIKK
jgi:hypothetical protein